jgi:hypothetical protein
MTLIGYTMMCEKTGPKQLAGDVALAEQAGFDFAVISDHYFPWLEAQGHSPCAWSVLGAAAQATNHLPLMTYVTCPSRLWGGSGSLEGPIPARSRRRAGSSDDLGSGYWWTSAAR